MVMLPDRGNITSGIPGGGKGTGLLIFNLIMENKMKITMKSKEVALKNN